MTIKPRKFRAFTNESLERIPQLRLLSPWQRRVVEVVGKVLPFRVNNYVLDELIAWDRIPDDPLYQLTFPQEGMLSTRDFNTVHRLLRLGARGEALDAAIRPIREGLNPHPSGQVDLNIPILEGRPQTGLQHKYRETLLYFPLQGQTCHTYCTYCFRWAQFVRGNFQFARTEVRTLVRYLIRHPEVRDVLITGGDPLVMRANLLRRVIEPLLKIGSVRTVRIGTKALAWWPYRFLTDPDADDVLRLFEEVVASGKHLAVMAHMSHPRELSTPAAQAAVARVRGTGALIRCQAPIVRHVNDAAGALSELWQAEVDVGAIPYYMFVERNTGPQRYFEVPLTRALHLFNEAFETVSGLGRTVRGPVMSATPGKVLLVGEAEVFGRRAFALRFLQARVPRWAGRVFFAKYDAEAVWFDDLVPLSGSRFFFEGEMDALRRDITDRTCRHTHRRAA